jgi:hypothetical protein
MYRIGGAAESTGSADSALELDYRGAFLGSGGGTSDQWHMMWK